MNSNGFLIHGYYLQKPCSEREIASDDISLNSLTDKSFWVHLDGNNDLVQNWLKNESNIDAQIVEIMLSKQTRARFMPIDKGFLIVLKAINQNPHGSPEDMVSIRIYLEKNRIISVCKKNILLLPNLNKKLSLSNSSISAFEIFIQIANELFLNLEEVIETLGDQIDEIDDHMDIVKGLTDNLVPELSQVRSKTIILKSYLTPQKEVFRELMNVQSDWFEKKSKSLFLNFSEKISLYVENIEVIKERAVVLLDEIRIRNAEKTNRNSYVFSIVAVLFLPLGFLTGLFGINLAGIPGAENPWAFTIFCLAIITLSVNLLILLKKIKWL